jgi:hypothetical protein
MLTLVAAYLLWERVSNMADGSPERRSRMLLGQTLVPEHVEAYLSEMR